MRTERGDLNYIKHGNHIFGYMQDNPDEIINYIQIFYSFY